jgi:hypothetical protein
LAQHEIAAVGDLAVRAYHEAMALEDDVSPGDEAKAMRVGIKEKSLALRLTTVANPEPGDQFLAQVIFIHSFLFQEILE